MSDVVISPNMNLPVPVVGTDPGPDWANNLNACLGILDQHDHTTGQGVPITPNGLNINIDLNIQSNNLTAVKTVNFTAQGSPLAGVSPNLGAVYVAGNELYYNDEVGNVVQITNNGAVNSGAGSITGLPSGTASASYSSGSATFIWQSATSTPANMDGGSFIFRNIVANSKGATVNAPSALAADYSLTLPLLPPANYFMSLDAAGNMGTAVAVNSGIDTGNLANNAVTTAKIADLNVTNIKRAPLGEQTTTGSGTPAFTNTTPVTVGGPVTITSVGRPIFISLTNTYASNNPSYIEFNSTFGAVQFLRGGVEIALITPNTSGGTSGFAASSFNLIDVIAAGTYQYEVRLFNTSSGSNVVWVNVGMIAYEL